MFNLAPFQIQFSGQLVACRLVQNPLKTNQGKWEKMAGNWAETVLQYGLKRAWSDIAVWLDIGLCPARQAVSSSLVQAVSGSLFQLC